MKHFVDQRVSNYLWLPFDAEQVWSDDFSWKQMGAASTKPKQQCCGLKTFKAKCLLYYTLSRCCWSSWMIDFKLPVKIIITKGTWCVKMQSLHWFFILKRKEIYGKNKNLCPFLLQQIFLFCCFDKKPEGVVGKILSTAATLTLRVHTSVTEPSDQSMIMQMEA